MASQQQLDLLKQGVTEIWNRWREDHPATALELSGVDLTGANLSAANLRDTNMHRANLNWTNLNEAIITAEQLKEARPPQNSQ